MTEVVDVAEVEEETPLPAVQESLPAPPAFQPPAVREIAELTVDELAAQVEKVQEIARRVMKENVHYGKLGPKPKAGEPDERRDVLFKSGAELLCLTFRLYPLVESTYTWHEDGHLDVISDCTIYSIISGAALATVSGFCSTREEKYAYRLAKRSCPQCGAEALIKGKAEWGGGWVCWAKGGGCGAKFADDTPEIVGQVVGRIENPNLPDLYNTCIKMSQKRALVAATIVASGGSHLWTQDLEDQTGETDDYTGVAERKSEPATTTASAATTTTTAETAQPQAEFKTAPQTKRRFDGWKQALDEIDRVVADPRNPSADWLKLCASEHYGKTIGGSRDFGPPDGELSMDAFNRLHEVYYAIAAYGGTATMPPEPDEVVRIWKTVFEVLPKEPEPEPEPSPNADVIRTPEDAAAMAAYLKGEEESFDA